ncbi:MAG: hypothetical protein AABW45_01150 [Nanoarchaeota archaeon]
MKFDPDKSLRNQSLDYRIIKIFKQEANSFLEELKHRKLEVILVPAPDPHHEGHKIRQKVNDNPEWYRELYWKYHPNFRRDRTLKSLNRLVNLEDGNFITHSYKYDAVMRELIYSVLIEGYYIDSHIIYPENPRIVKYFKK